MYFVRLVQGLLLSNAWLQHRISMKTLFLSTVYNYRVRYSGFQDTYFTLMAIYFAGSYFYSKNLYPLLRFIS